MLQLDEIRQIVTSNMPYDTGFMSLAGARYMDTEHFLVVKYATERVPYLVPQEEGFVHWISGKFIDKNQYFIRDKTVGDLMMHAQYKQAGMKLPFSRLNDRVKRRASTDMIKQGAIDKIRSESRGNARGI